MLGAIKDKMIVFLFRSAIIATLVTIVLIANANGASNGAWVQGRATWFGTPRPFVDPYLSTRGGGESAFGILEVSERERD